LENIDHEGKHSMRSEALFINGVFESVIEEILLIQVHLPEHVMYMQPYASSPITHLRDDPPTPEDPVRVYISVTTDLPTLCANEGETPTP